MKKLNIQTWNVTVLRNNELLNVNGGSFQSGYEAGNTAGATVRRWVDTALTEWAILRLIFRR